MKKLMWMVMGLFISLTLALPVFAQGDDGGKVVFGGTFTLESGETLDGDLVVFGGEATLEEDSLVRGDVVILGGRGTVAGEIEGHIVIFGGTIELEETAEIGGQLVRFGAAVQREEGAVIRGGEAVTFGAPGLSFPGFQRWRPVRPWDRLGAIVWGVVQAIGRAVVLTILGLLIVVLWPEPSQRVGSTVVAEPLRSLGMGLLSLLVAFCVGLVLLIAACSGLLIWLAAVIAWIFGWTAVGLIVGQRVLAAFNVQPTPPVAAIVGVALISLIWAFPCLGSLFALVVGSVGVGAVLLTRAGTQPYPLAPLPALQSEESVVAEQ